MVQFVWPRGLTLRDINRLVYAKFSHRIPDFLAALSERGVNLTPEDAHTLVDSVVAASVESGFYVLDHDVEPETLELPELPNCVLVAVENVYVDYRDMQRILDMYHGTNLSDDLTDKERRRRLRQQRRRPVLTAICRQRGCDRPVEISVFEAANAIIKHKLIEQGELYEPSTLCSACRKKRDASLKEKRAASRSRPVATIGDLMAAKNKARGKQEDVDADSSPAATAPLTEDQEQGGAEAAADPSALPPPPPEQVSEPSPVETA